MAQSISPAVQKDFRDDLLVASSPSFISSDADILPVMAVGQGIARNNARQAVKTFSILKTSVGGETFYVQVATVTANTRLFFLSAVGLSVSGTFYLEDASSGNVAFTDGGSVALAYDDGGTAQSPPSPFPRECKRGIRAAVVVPAAGTTWAIVYYLEEKIDGQLENL